MSKKPGNPTIDISGIKPVEQWFHNEKIPVYQTDIDFDQVKYWAENFRTQLDFELLSQQEDKPLSKLSVEKITDYLTRQKLKLSELAKSIQRNGVRVPLIVLDDGTLLDGNRRFFSCAYLKKRAEEKGQPRPPVLNRIPVWVIKVKDIDARKRTKILAEMNFVTDPKMDWPLSVKAKLVHELYQRCLQEGKTESEACDEIYDLYAVDVVTAKAYVEAVDLTAKFVRGGGKKHRDDYRRIVQEKFVYFWEFRNKASELDTKKELPKVRKLFFSMVANDRVKNIKRVEPIIWAVRHDYEWKILTSSGGSKIDQIEALFKEEKAIRSAEDKIEGFYRWLQKLDPVALNKRASNLLKNVASLSKTKANA